MKRSPTPRIATDPAVLAVVVAPVPTRCVGGEVVADSARARHPHRAVVGVVDPGAVGVERRAEVVEGAGIGVAGIVLTLILDVRWDTLPGLAPHALGFLRRRRWRGRARRHLGARRSCG